MTRKEKKKYNSQCAYCGKNSELQSAHIRDLDRITIIYNILDEKFRKKDFSKTNQYDVDLDAFEKEFEKQHDPISQHFYFLCQSCHNKYDNGLIKEKEMKATTRKNLKNKKP